MEKSRIIILVVLAGVIAVVIWQRFIRDDFNLPRGGETKIEKISIPDSEAGGNTSFSTKEIMITNGVKHSVPLKEVIGGGPQKDGIPSIDKPKFISINEADGFLKDTEPGISVETNGVARFYPFQILVWHEIVNDVINGQRILVTYCPLCLSGIVFDPVVKGERVEFGTSGKLWNSNLVMYDRKTESLWSQILGEAIVGEMTGVKLKVLPSDQLRYGEFKKLHPQGEVLSRATGAVRIYGSDPYGDYYTTPGTYFPISKKDDRLQEKDFVLGIVVDGKAKAYFPPAVKQKGEITDNFQGKTIVAQYEKDIDAVRLFQKTENGKLERINPFGAFWFSWVA
ncbi:DUF3179 domain-containing protein, partial [Candidatus Wolfebacteria bacterium]|nr:DUF3179 domain-containing protein [Candidatus Wolfebacteria bacterium]